jgi:hypothetical protein
MALISVLIQTDIKKLYHFRFKQALYALARIGFFTPLLRPNLSSRKVYLWDFCEFLFFPKQIDSRFGNNIIIFDVF